MFSSPNIIQVIKSRRKLRPKVNPRGEKTLGRTRVRWAGQVNMRLQEVAQGAWTSLI